MKNRLLCTVAIFVTVFCACTVSPVETALDGAARIMNEDPDSALRWLAGMDRRALTVQRWRARHALLYAQALDKNFINVDEDSLIGPARDYFNRHGTRHERFLANYYYGRMLYNRGEHAQALLLFLNIEEQGRTLNDPYTLGMLYHDISELYLSQYDYPNMLDYAKLAYQCYCNAGLQRHQNYAAYFLAMAYRNIGDLEKSKEYYHQTLHEAEIQCDTDMQYSCFRSLASVYNEQCQPIIARQMLLDIRDKLGLQWCARDYIELSTAYRCSGDLDSALLCISTAKSLIRNTTFSSLYSVSAEIYYEMGDYKQAADDYLKCLDYQDSIARIALKQSYVSLHRDYLDQQQHISKQLVIVLKQRIWLIAAVVLLLIVFLATVFYFYRGHHQRIVEGYIALIEEGTAANHHLEHLIQHTSMESKQLLQNHFSMLDQLASLTYQLQGTKAEQKATFNAVKRWVMSYSEDDKLKKEIEEIVNFCNDRILDNLRTELPQLKESEIEFLALIYVGFTPRVISVFTGDSLGNIYTKKSRLKTKIESSDAPSKMRFLEQMG